MGERLTLYLDQQYWVRLARIAGGLSTEPTTKALLDLLRERVADGTLELLLGAANYLELWHRGSARSRNSVAELMRDMTNYGTIASLDSQLTWQLTSAILDVRRGLSVPVRAAVGRGANHAFSSVTGRMRLVDSVARDGVDEGSPTTEGIAPFLQLQVRSDAAYQWLMLAGVDSDVSPFGPGVGGADIHTMADVRPEHRLGSEAAAEDQRERDWIWSRARPEDMERWVQMGTLLSVKGCVDEVLARWQISAASIRAAQWREIHDRCPALVTYTALRLMRCQDRNMRIEQHDRTDMLALCGAIPVCDVVATEPRWAHFAARARLGQRFGTSVVGKTKQLVQRLQA